jgi:hypothetical protein
MYFAISLRTKNECDANKKGGKLVETWNSKGGKLIKYKYNKAFTHIILIFRLELELEG